ncbi:MAG: radical SAM superfamily enzyme YgiQ (UPF0313 family) [Bradymonadia bacterium]|jgi:radical SAM superfamily enzyme YgiQ (UPF0313 family)
MPHLQRVLLVLPPLTQLNTPYPSTAYLTGYLREQGYEVSQIDLGIELIDSLFSRDGVRAIFGAVDEIGALPEEWDDVCDQSERYASTIDAAMSFLRGDDPSLATRIASRRFLPEGPRFWDADDVDWAFGQLGVRDRARFIATRYLDDLADVIRQGVNPHFAFTRYAESLALAASSYEPLADALSRPPDLVDQTMLAALFRRVDEFQPDVVGFSVPFPGNLYGALRCGSSLRTRAPNVIRVLGGGYPNTELRSLDEPRVFESVEYVTLDDGELPFVRLLSKLRGEDTELRRTFERVDGRVVFHEGVGQDILHSVKPAPDYRGLNLHKYLSVLQVPNPMHRLWSDGRWNKLTIAHGCYWGKCSFCDVTLDYISRYDGTSAAHLVDQMLEVAAQTGERGFHFVDEAAPPAGLRDLALEILARDEVFSWWTNIRFEKSFSPDLCRLLAESGCIAVSGGLEVASDRLLTMMKKGVSVDQVARVANSFSEAGVLVHSYLMYGFPTQTTQETVDALEVVRQLFASGVIQSGFWHRFAMTAHAPAGLHPDEFGVKAIHPEGAVFARNDLEHVDRTGTPNEELGHGLKLALDSFMRGENLDRPVYEWFELPVPPSTIDANRIASALLEEPDDSRRLNSMVVWLGGEPDWLVDPTTGERAGLAVMGRDEYVMLETDEQTSSCLASLLASARPIIRKQTRLGQALAGIPRDTAVGILSSDAWRTLRQNGLLLV